MALQVSGTCRTSDPTLVNAQTYSLKLDTAGNLRVSVADATAPVSAAGENHIGEVGVPYTLVDVTPVLDTIAYAAGDVLFTTITSGNLLRKNDGLGLLKSIQVIDKGDQGVAFDLYLFQTNVTFGPFNAPPTISDADAATLLGKVSIASGDYTDLGGVRVACKPLLDIVLKAATGAKNIYLAAVTQGAPTYAASDIVIRLGVEQN